MDITVLEINGSKKADEHYRETGHFIELLGKEVALHDDYYDKIKFYKCQECDFTSQGGRRVKRY